MVRQAIYASDLMDFGVYTVEYINLGAQGDPALGSRIVLDQLQIQLSDPEDTLSTSVPPSRSSSPSTNPSALQPPNAGPTSELSQKSDDDDSENMGSANIAGTVVAAVGGALLLALLVWFCLRRWRARAGSTGNISPLIIETINHPVCSTQPQLPYQQNGPLRQPLFSCSSHSPTMRSESSNEQPLVRPGPHFISRSLGQTDRIPVVPATRASPSTPSERSSFGSEQTNMTPHPNSIGVSRAVQHPQYDAAYRQLNSYNSNLSAQANSSSTSQSSQW